MYSHSKVDSIKIVGLGKCLPKRILTNLDLEKMVDTSEDWITTRTGIKERRIVDKEYASILGSDASLKALKRASIKPKDVELIIVATITPDTQFPSTACYIQKDIGAKNAAVLDVSAACAGFVYALGLAWSLVGGGFYKNALVVGSEILSSITDWKDRSTCILFGDGAGACVVVPAKPSSGMLGMYLGGDGNFADLLILPAGGSRLPAANQTVKKRLHYIKMQGNELFKIAVRIMVECAQKVLKKCGLKNSDLDLLIPHQANLRIINAVAKRLNLTQEQVFVNIHKYGNMSSASTAVALCEAYEQGRIKKGDIVVLDAFGGGLVWGSCVIKWT
ncbi:MAG: ketoacyl-ACP synthase III [Candidatus Omnitrophica bacterium]|nr:ketoacyl-ACP synthase III [Candidatus Omnitrophota bacterium]